ncbi:MAG: 16S rRNA (cytidine(1402)-2'-O)-methyltransferase [Thermodesulfobacteriota bacterium]
MGVLRVVATPIGNMEDITLRALRVLKESDLIAAEDTRRTRKLLSHYGISTPLTSYFEHNERAKAPRIVKKLKEGSDVALVSDAGTPGISDPGYRLVRLALEEGVRVEAVPGPSALTAVLSVAGLPIDEFTFKGFVPSAAGRRKKFLLGLRGTGSTVVLYESARRLKATLAEIGSVLGDVEVVVAREMTKLHEELVRGRAEEVAGLMKGRTLKGEVTLVVRTEKVEIEAEDAAGEIRKLLDEGFTLKDAVKAVTAGSGLPKSVVYKEALGVKKGG